MSETAQPTSSVDVSVVPDDERDKALQALYKYTAAATTNNDPVIMGSIKETPSLLSFVGLTLVLGLIAFVISEMANYNEIRQNWEKYRCQPSIAPFAKFYGHDVTETLNFCAAEAVKEHAPGVMAPIYEGVNKMIGVVDGVYEKAEAVESGIAGLIGGFATFVTNFVNSLGLIGTRIRMSIVRIKDIFMRLYGSFIAFVYAGISAITFGNNLICNPLVTFVAGFAGVDLCCFAPDTQIAVAGATGSKAIKDIVIGDVLVGEGDVRVTSVYRFDGRSTAMVRLHGIHVSGNHYVPSPSGIRNSKMIHAAAHPDAIPADSLPVIYCLATTTNTIPVLSPVTGVTHQFADYEESYDPAVIAQTQRLVEEALNSSGQSGPTVADYSLGFPATTKVRLLNHEMRTLAEIQLGDVLESGRTVVGLVEEVCADVCEMPEGMNLRMAAAQLVYWGGSWQRAGNVWPRSAGSVAVAASESYRHLLLAGDDNVFMVYTDAGPLAVRDYAEHMDDAVTQTAYDRAMSGSD